MPSRCRPAAALACVLASCAAAPAQPTPRFYDLTQGSPYSVNGAAAISRDGTVAGDLGFLPDGQYGYLWNAEEGIHALTPPTPTAISADGTTTVGSTVVGSYVWRLGQGHTILPRPSGYDMPRPRDVSGDGSVVVGELRASAFPWPSSFFRWTAQEGMVALGNGRAEGISADARTIVGSAYEVTPGSGGFEAFRYTDEGGQQSLGIPAGHWSSYGEAVSDDGTIVVGYVEQLGPTLQLPFRWTEQHGMELGNHVPGGRGDTRAFDVSDTGVAVGRSTGADRLSLATIWRPGEGVRLLQEVLEDEYGMDLSGWILRVARGISADGTMICGEGVYWTGDRYLGRSFVAVIPAPAAAAVLMSAGLLACRRRRGVVQSR